MEGIKDMIKNGDVKGAKEKAELELLEKGFVKTDFFGWITVKEFDWLNKRLAEAGYPNADQLDTAPVEETFNSKGFAITKVHPLLEEFEIKREEINNAGFKLVK